MKKLIFLIAIISCACSGQKTNTEDQIVPEMGMERTIYPEFIGVNGNVMGTDKPWDNQELLDGFKNLEVSTLRYPAGTLGNYWNWDTGWIETSIPDSFMIKWVVEHEYKKKSNTYTLENFAKAINYTGATPVFMLNMLSKDLEHALRGLRRARDLGLEVKYVEMGNELYFGLPFERSVYPTPEDYGKTCEEWITAIKQEFPGVKCAILATSLRRNKRHTDWTQRALNHCNNADAIIFHTYSPTGIDGAIEKKKITAGTEGKADENTSTRKMPEDLLERQQWEIAQLEDPKALANMLVVAEGSATKYNKLGAPKDMEVWVTEFNLRADDSAIRGTWANVFYISTYYNEFLKSNRVALTNIHNITGDKFPMIYMDENGLDYIKHKSIKTEVGSLSAAGWVTRLYNRAMEGNTKAIQLTFPKGRELENDNGVTIPELTGWLFGNENKLNSGIIFNRGYEEQEINFSDFGLKGEVTIYSASLDNYVVDENGISFQKLKLENNLVMPPHSAAIINLD